MADTFRPSEIPSLHLVAHPLIQHKLTIMRMKETGTKEFRELLSEISMLMAYEITRDFPLCSVEIETPVAPCRGQMLEGKKLGIVPILRAGLGMLDGILTLVPAARVGHIGLYRDPETLAPVEYYAKLPTGVEDRTLIVPDPMLATGGSASAALTLLKEKGAKKAVILPVSAPFHSTLMEPAAKKLAAELDKVQLHDAAFPVVSNYTGGLQQRAAEIKENLIAQADHPVRWIACVNTMREFGADTYVECGPGKTLAGFNKRIDKTLTSLNVENAASLQKTLDTLKK